MFWSASAQASNPVPLSSVVDGAPLGSSVAFREDSSKNWTVDDAIRSQSSGDFSLSQSDTISLGYTDSAYWFHLSIMNDTGAAQSRFLQVGYPLLDHVVMISNCGGSV